MQGEKQEECSSSPLHVRYTHITRLFFTRQHRRHGAVQAQTNGFVQASTKAGRCGK